MNRPDKPRSTFGHEYDTYVQRLEGYAHYLEGKLEAYENMAARLEQGLPPTVPTGPTPHVTAFLEEFFKAAAK